MALEVKRVWRSGIRVHVSLAMVLLTLAAAPRVPRVASPDWATVDVRPALVTFYQDAFAQALRSRGLEVVLSQDMTTLLGVERQRQLLGCADSGCMVELANALGCEATLTVSLAHFPHGYRAVVKLLSSRDARVLSGLTLEAADDRQLLKELERGANVLAGALSTSAPVPQTASAPAPGWLVPLIGGATVAGSGAVFFVLSKARFDAIPQAISYAQANEWAALGRAFQTTAWVASAVGSAALVAALVWALAPASPRVSLTVTTSGIAIGGSW